MRKQRGLYVNNLVGDISTKSCVFYKYESVVRKRILKVFPILTEELTLALALRWNCDRCVQ